VAHVPISLSSIAHLMDLKKGYETSARYAKILGNYQRGRVDRFDRAQIDVADDVEAIDDSGRPTPYAGDEG
jgi:hypothetical protein